jgi:opacity protein-like surface antigen
MTTIVRPFAAAVVFAGFVGLLGPGPADAQGFVSPLVGYDFGGDSGCPEITGCEDKNLNLGVALGSFGTVFGAELELGYAKDFFGDLPGVSSSVLTLMGNLMLAPRFGPVRPYGLIGIGLIRTDVEIEATSLLDSETNHFGWDVGGGLVLMLAQHVGLRGDVRYFHGFRDFGILGINFPETRLDFGRASAGVVFSF